jgi:hypothetical protein
MAARDAAHLNLSQSMIELNTAAFSGGGVALQGMSDVHVDPLGVVIRSNAAKFGGGMYAESKEFVVDQIFSVVFNNSADFNADVYAVPSTLTVVGGSSVVDFVSRPAAHEGVLPVKVVVTGIHEISCEGVEVKAEFEGRYHLATSISGKGGLTEYWLRVQQPPGLYNITFSAQGPLGAVPPAILSLHVRHCIRGEVSPSPDTCMVCLPGSYSSDPSLQTCQPCPEQGASCPGGAAIVPQPGWWHSSRDSTQMHM